MKIVWAEQNPDAEKAEINVSFLQFGPINQCIMYSTQWLGTYKLRQQQQVYKLGQTVHDCCFAQDERTTNFPKKGF